MACFYTEGDRHAVIFLLSSENYDNVNAASESSQITNFSRNVLQELVNLFTSSSLVVFFYIDMA